MIEVPIIYVGKDFTVGIELRRDDLDQAVTVPGAAGQPEALRIQQIVRPEMPRVLAGAQMPADIYSRMQWALAFPAGLPLPPGVTYRWQVEVDGKARKEWAAVFHVLAPAQGPIFGGPSAPPDPALPKLDT